MDVPSSSATLKLAVEEAIYEAAPDLTAILVQGEIQDDSLRRLSVLSRSPSLAAVAMAVNRTLNSEIKSDGRKCLVLTRFLREPCAGQKSAAATFFSVGSKKLYMRTTTLVLDAASRWGPLASKAQFSHAPSVVNTMMSYVPGAVLIWIAFI